MNDYPTHPAEMAQNLIDRRNLDIAIVARQAARRKAAEQKAAEAARAQRTWLDELLIHWQGRCDEATCEGCREYATHVAADGATVLLGHLPTAQAQYGQDEAAGGLVALACQGEQSSAKIAFQRHLDACARAAKAESDRWKPIMHRDRNVVRAEPQELIVPPLRPGESGRAG